MSSQGGQTVDLGGLSTQQLSQVKKQLDEELEHLTSSFTQLRAAQAKFRECLNSIATGVSPKVEGKTILVPLTSSLYVPGTLADTENVIVDVGTGYYVEKSTKDAAKFYTAKVDELQTNLKDLESIVQGKSNNLRVVEDVLRQKVLSGNAGAPAAE
ncbi:subunit of tubulin prefoldin [Pseudogymnoascus destructans]|uniref:Prefoldin, alpha subunit n=2 Tax=Pseudogymnoascus destructans TaxID=655981 RepID=L8G5B9_PSED2|nr:subunit of tubulin prefoldin [Pseudogymnoascus destructans]ELR08024.1 prefoldin, alpha subunit [Pseudogymnoascus destructans 20631-21]OAF60792.1 subunit of tubulin prefoldin [Pseudogymnoascus destructans]OBT75287.1 prefoldin, alpha subunit [Pseudogymnoascus sp. 05NY08]